jgi:hypothetical protein
VRGYDQEARNRYDDAIALFYRVARERLGIIPDEIDGGHTAALSRPRELADRLETYAAELGLPGDRHRRTPSVPS